MMVPADAETVDIGTVNMDEYRRFFPATPDFYRAEWFPAGVPAPTPPSVNYFHREIARTTDVRLRNVWLRIIELEWATLYLAAW